MPALTHERCPRSRGRCLIWGCLLWRVDAVAGRGRRYPVRVGLTLSQRTAVIKQTARRYRRVDRVRKKVILDQWCALTGWHRDHTRKALREALTSKWVRPRTPRPPAYGEEVIAALRMVWAVLDAPAGKRRAPFMAEIVDRLRGRGELEISGEVRDRLVSMSAATIDRRLAGERARMRRAVDGPLENEARFVAQEPDPDPNLGGLEREQACPEETSNLTTTTRGPPRSERRARSSEQLLSRYALNPVTTHTTNYRVCGHSSLELRRHRHTGGGQIPPRRLRSSNSR